MHCPLTAFRYVSQKFVDKLCAKIIFLFSMSGFGLNFELV
jgi:hypothetical protein